MSQVPLSSLAPEYSNQLQPVQIQNINGTDLRNPSSVQQFVTNQPPSNQFVVETTYLSNKPDCPCPTKKPDCPPKQPECPVKKPDCPPKRPECPPKQPECPVKKPDCPPKRPDCPPKQPDCPPKQPECPPKKPDCPPKQPECPPKQPECPPKNPCDPCATGGTAYTYGWGWGWLGALVLWFIIFTVLFWLIYYSLKPSFVLQTDSNQVDTGKVLLAAVISALILVIIIWLIKAAITRRY